MYTYIFLAVPGVRVVTDVNDSSFWTKFARKVAQNVNGCLSALTGLGSDEARFLILFRLTIKLIIWHITFDTQFLAPIKTNYL
jgi:hypothetical protein